MTNKERYQRTFRALHASERMMEVKTMKRSGHFAARKVVPAALVAVLVLGLATIAYANNIGGIRRTIQLWIHGDPTNAVMEIEDGSYTLTYTDAQGEMHEQSGGGVAMDADGSERPVTAEEMIEVLDSPDVEYEADGTVKVYYHNQVIDITDRFENGICRVKIVNGDENIYMTVKYKNGFSTSNDWYPDPRQFN